MSLSQPAAGAAPAAPEEGAFLLPSAGDGAPAPVPTPDARVALVLGAGGLAGVAFHAGVLSALADSMGWDPRTVDLVVGTSAGALTAAALRAGLSASDLLARACDQALSSEGRVLMARADAAVAGRVLETPGRRPRLSPAAPEVLLAAARRPGRVRPGALLAGMLPAGRVPTALIADGVDAMSGGTWPERPTWVCAVRLGDGALSVFGRDDAPPATIGHAVAASCAIPGYFAPVTIDGVRYVDGGAHSTFNLGEVANRSFDLVVVSAPMAQAGSRPWPPVPPGLPAALGAAGRELNRWQLGREARRVREQGTPVLAFSPTARDLKVMGLNPMESGRRAPIARQARESALRRLERPEVRHRLAALSGGGRRAGAQAGGEHVRL